MKTELNVKGMACNGCKNAVSKALSKVEGVELVEVDLPTGKVTVKTSQPVEKALLVQAVEKAGYTAE